MGWSGRAPAPPANEAGRGRRRPHEATDPCDFRLLLPARRHPFDSYGANNLNQGIFTVMSYNHGWDQVQNPLGNDLTTYGFVGGPMAFDIAAIQYLYGPNTSFHNGNNTYTLPDSNAPGTYWTCIWDAGGVDQIVLLSHGQLRACATSHSRLPSV